LTEISIVVDLTSFHLESAVRGPHPVGAPAMLKSVA
jgi:hypothetical protein